jgi:hypothetical protein
MKDLHVLLNDADPVRVDPGMPDAQARAMRRAVLSAVKSQHTVAMLWPGAVSMAALVAVMIVAGAAAGRRLAPPEPVLLKAASALEGTPEGDRTQVQFATPGGTRIIWTLDPQFELGVMP